MVETSAETKPKRLMSLDAYRGFIMLVMASAGFGFAQVADKPEVLNRFVGTPYESYWFSMWTTLGYQFSHVEWTGCSFWDLIQPSFMFMVGVAMPYSYSRRSLEGQSEAQRFGHVLRRSAILVILGVFLSSNGAKLTNFTFVNVLSQIGLGYAFVYLLLGRSLKIQWLAVVVVLAGYWLYFYQYTMPSQEKELVTNYLSEVRDQGAGEWSQFDGLAAHWNKHTNAAAGFDRKFLNLFPRSEDEWNGRSFWVNTGGYQTLNFIPSIATMLLGLMAGTVLRSDRSEMNKLRWLVTAGAICLVSAMAIDTSIWPMTFAGANWSFCPIVKRIWSPSWAVFSSGWTFWILAAFYWVIDVRGWKRWSFPLVVVGMNSIAMYCMSQLIKPWAGRTVKTHLATIDAIFHWDHGLAYFLSSDSFPYARIFEYSSRLLVLWLICLWMYRKKIFIRI